MSRRHKRRKPMAEINVVPYIDVTLVLLIIFMITTPMLQTGVEVELPHAQAAVVDSGEGEPPVVISIKQSGEYFLSVGGQSDEPIAKDEIDARVSGILSEKPGIKVLINADKSVEYGAVVTVMASLKEAGVPNVGLMTKSDDQ
jgi:biopolymer transport protein TolR